MLYFLFTSVLRITLVPCYRRFKIMFLWYVKKSKVIFLCFFGYFLYFRFLYFKFIFFLLEWSAYVWCVCEAWVSSGCITNLHFHVIRNNFHTANALLQHSFFPTFPRFSFWDNCFLLIGLSNVRSSHWRCSVIQGVLRNFAKFTGKRLRQSLIFNKVAGWCLELIKEETLAQVFSCEFCKISKNTLYYRTPPDSCFCNVYEVQQKDVDTKDCFTLQQQQFPTGSAYS